MTKRSNQRPERIAVPVTQKTKTLQKSTVEQRASKRQMGTAAIETVRRSVDRLRPYELSHTQRLTTYQRMLLDADVYTPYIANCTLIEKAFKDYQVMPKTGSAKSERAADFIRYCIENMTSQTARSLARSCADFKRDGCAIFEKVLKRGDGKYADKWVLDKFVYIHPLTLDPAIPYTVDEGGRRWRSIRQSQNAFLDTAERRSNVLQTMPLRVIEIPANKLVVVSNTPSEAQPFGVSVFDSIYEAWRSKSLIQDATVTGVFKDFSGTPVLYIPSDLQEEARSNPGGWEARYLQDLQVDMANMHVGDQSYITLPSDPYGDSGSGHREFDIKFLGVEGRGKNFDTVALIEQYKKAIYNVFGAANLLAGDQGGSYNLIEGQNSIHAHFVERDVAVIEDTFWNKNVIPMLLRLNNFDLTPDEMPKLRAGEVDPVSIDEFGKFIQRVGTAGYLPKTPSVVNTILATGGFAERMDDNADVSDLLAILPESTSAAGRGNGTSGTGETQAGSGDGTENTA